MSFTKKFSKIGSVPLAGEVDFSWDHNGCEVVADEIRVSIRGEGSMTLRRKDPDYRGELFAGFESALIEQFDDDADVCALWRAAEKRELGNRHLQRELI